MPRTVTIGGATVNQTPMDWAGNSQNILDAIAVARNKGISILCFPELCITGYGCEDVHLSEWLNEAAWSELQRIVPACINITACIGLPIRIDGITYNGVAVIHNQKIIGITLKQNLARDGVHYEPRWFNAWPKDSIGELKRDDCSIPIGDIIYEAHGIRFGFEICEDAWRKQNRPGYRLQKRGVDLIINPSASHFAMGKSELREKEVVTEGSGKFNCVYLFVNVLGNEAGRMIYDGDIMIGQKGKTLAINKRLSFHPFNVLGCTINFDDPLLSEVLPLNDNKERNEEFARAASLALFDYLRKSRAKGFALSLSGGADSSCCAILVAEMVRRGCEELGLEAFCKKLNLVNFKTQAEVLNKILVCVYQETINSSETTLVAARDLALSLTAEFHHVNINDGVKSYESKIEKVLGRKLNWDTDDIARQNIQARTRSPLIWMLANIRGAILLTTSNRSEGDVGYATMDGDMSGSLAPIAGVDKPFILQWLQWAESSLGYSGLAKVNALQPTAELRPVDRTQTDEKDLMPYKLLVAIERLAILHRQSPKEIYFNLKVEYPDLLKESIKKFFKLWSANQWKRERLAPSFHLDDFNVDPRSWCRFPILSGSFEKELNELDVL